ncbi:hypothetical protein [Georgenia sp. SUBG003]|uniref:hypothetical protein n=1 Tax=Georgenia sp. SUBG003 TaxID=1497974 RepID=UPI003AB8818C
MLLFLSRRVLNYVVLLFVAVSLVYILAATQLDPRMLYEQRNPPGRPRVDRERAAVVQPQRPGPAPRALLDVAERGRHAVGLGARTPFGASAPAPRPALLVLAAWVVVGLALMLLPVRRTTAEPAPVAREPLVTSAR